LPFARELEKLGEDSAALLTRAWLWVKPRLLVFDRKLDLCELNGQPRKPVDARSLTLPLGDLNFKSIQAQSPVCLPSLFDPDHLDHLYLEYTP
jgi:hypothetical protein